MLGASKGGTMNELGLIMALVDTACQVATAIGVIVIAFRVKG